MTGPGVGPHWRTWIGPSALVLAGAALLLAVESGLPTLPAIVLGLAGVSAGLALRARRASIEHQLAPVPVLAMFGLLAATAPLGPLPEIAAGAAGVSVLLWLADDPARPVGGIGRGAIGWALPGLAVALAWLGAAVLPGGALPLGTAAVLLAGALLAIAYFVRRPEALAGDGTQAI